MTAMRTFNTAGPVRADRHYHIPPLERIDLDAVLGLIREEKYFVLHAPRQTGKTSALLALRDLLNGGNAGDYRCVYANVEAGQAFTEGALELIGTRTAGQPWLVNALCYDACFRHKLGRDRARPITADAVVAAQERLILRRDTHIDDLANKLREERVRRVVAPILAGADEHRSGRARTSPTCATWGSWRRRPTARRASPTRSTPRWCRGT